jgi:hypothetical protein
MRSVLLLVACLFAAAVEAAPTHIELVYDLFRNGQKLGQVTDTFTRNGKHYTLVSETRSSGPLALLWPGTIRLESRGVVTRQGLLPTQFQHARSDAPHKLATARFDWKQHRVDFQYKGRAWQVSDLQSGAQDQLSQLYQMVFAPSLPVAYVLQVASGRDLKDYRYARSNGGILKTPLGELDTQQYQRVDHAPDQKSVSVWIAPARQNLPVQVRVVDDGVTLEQRLVRASVKG